MPEETTRRELESPPVHRDALDGARSPAVAGRGAPASARQLRAPKGRVRVFGQWCKGCGLCMAFCPQGVFESNGEGRPAVAHPERCTACEWCCLHCPDFAISVTRLGDEDAGGMP